MSIVESVEDIRASRERRRAFRERIAAQAAQLAAAKVAASDKTPPRFVVKGFSKPQQPARLSVWDEFAWNLSICGQEDVEQITMRRIKSEVCRHFAITPLELASHRRTRNHSYPRFVAFLLSKDLTSNSLSQIGRFFGRDHTSVMSGLKRIERLVSENHPIANDIRQIRSRLV